MNKPLGAVSINSFRISYNNTILIEDCHFVGNVGNAGGAFSVALYDSDTSSYDSPDRMNFTNYSFIDNAADNEGTAVGLFSLVHVDQVGFPVSFEDWSAYEGGREGEREKVRVGVRRERWKEGEGEQGKQYYMPLYYVPMYLPLLPACFSTTPPVGTQRTRVRSLPSVSPSSSLALTFSSATSEGE